MSVLSRFLPEAPHYALFELVSSSLRSAPQGVDGNGQSLGQSLAMLDLCAFLPGVILYDEVSTIGGKLPQAFFKAFELDCVVVCVFRRPG